MSEENIFGNGLCEENDQHNNNENKKQITIVLDYDLDMDERKDIFQNYDLILCEKCNHKIDGYHYYCESCYEKETGVEKNRIEYGKCIECLQVLTGYSNCLSCTRKHFQQDFDKWTSGNEGINKLIQDIQLNETISHTRILEWIPYDKFSDIEYIAEGGFAKVYSATWTDGNIKKWNLKSNNWKRSGPFKVALKVFNNSSKNLNEDFINEVCIIKYY